MPISDLLASITGEPSPTLPPVTTSTPKRKAQDSFSRSAEKLQRTSNGTQAANPGRPVNQTERPSTVKSAPAHTKVLSKVNSTRPSTSFKNGQPTPPPTAETHSNLAAPLPKKGSFAEIMLRGKAAQQTLGQVGKIQHKRIEKVPSKRERDEMKAQKGEQIQKNIGPNGKFKSVGLTGNARVVGQSKETTRSQPVPEKKVKKAAAATTGYTGTARPKPGGSKPSYKPYGSGSSRAHDRYRDDRASSSHRYTYASEEEDDEEDEQDYASDVSSDMEAAAFEVDDEEEEAARIARKEDAEALAEENRHKREKLEKKARLAELAKRRR